jgi:hypothetical protein
MSYTTMHGFTNIKKKFYYKRNCLNFVFVVDRLFISETVNSEDIKE